MGPAKALELLFISDVIDVTEALRLGLANRVVAPNEVTDATSELAQRLADGPTLAYGFAKEAVYEGADLPFDSLLDREVSDPLVPGSILLPLGSTPFAVGLLVLVGVMSAGGRTRIASSNASSPDASTE